MEWSRSNGITGVPTTIFNSRFTVVGAQDVDLLRDVAGRIVRRDVGDRGQETGDRGRARRGAGNGFLETNERMASPR